MSIKIGNLSKVSPHVEALIRTFYKEKENDAVYEEIYEEAAKWRDAHLHEYVIIDFDIQSGDFSLEEVGPLAANSHNRLKI